MAILHKKDGQRPAQKGQKCDLGEKSAYICRRLGAKMGVSQKKRNRRFLSYETSEIRLSVPDHTFYPQRENAPPGRGGAGGERTSELLGRNGAQGRGALGGSGVSAGGRHAGAGGAQAVQQLPDGGLSEVTAGKNFAGCVETACVFLRRIGSHRGLRRIERIGGSGKMQLPGEFSSHRGRTYEKVIDFYHKAVTM